MSGPSGNLAADWDLVEKSGLFIEDLASACLFLACVQERFEQTIACNTVREFSYNMAPLLRNTSFKYIEMVKTQLGKDVGLETSKQVLALFLLEDLKIAPSGRPLCACKVARCSRCIPAWTKEKGPPNLVARGANGLGPRPTMCF